jgi:hypothetical protein
MTKKSLYRGRGSLRCGICGQFISKPADSYVPFGSYYDEEEPEPVFFCKKCLLKDITFYREIGTMPQRWRHADYEKELANELGFTFVVEKGCAWGRWIKNDKAIH